MIFTYVTCPLLEVWPQLIRHWYVPESDLFVLMKLRFRRVLLLDRFSSYMWNLAEARKRVKASSFTIPHPPVQLVMPQCWTSHESRRPSPSNANLLSRRAFTVFKQSSARQPSNKTCFNKITHAFLDVIILSGDVPLKIAALHKQLHKYNLQLTPMVVH